MIEYRGYTAVLEVDDRAGIIFGSTIGMADVVTFRGATVDEAKASFRESVDFYLSECHRTGKEPGRPFSGKFQVRVPGDVHRALALAAESRGVSLNEAIRIAVGRFLEAEGSREPHTATLALDDPRASAGTPRAVMTEAKSRPKRKRVGPRAAGARPR